MAGFVFPKYWGSSNKRLGRLPGGVKRRKNNPDVLTLCNVALWDDVTNPWGGDTPSGRGLFLVTFGSYHPLDIIYLLWLLLQWTGCCRRPPRLWFFSVYLDVGSSESFHLSNAVVSWNANRKLASLFCFNKIPLGSFWWFVVCELFKRTESLKWTHQYLDVKGLEFLLKNSSVFWEGRKSIKNSYCIVFNRLQCWTKIFQFKTGV